MPKTINKNIMKVFMIALLSLILPLSSLVKADDTEGIFNDYKEIEDPQEETLKTIYEDLPSEWEEMTFDTYQGNQASFFNAPKAEPLLASFTNVNGATLQLYTSATSSSSITYISVMGSYNGVVPVLDQYTHADPNKSRTKIAVAGVVGWINNTVWDKSANNGKGAMVPTIKLTPFSQAQSYNIYKYVGNEFIHYLSRNADGKDVTPLYQGGKPHNTAQGGQYLSFDGHYFYPATSSGMSTLIADYNAGHRNNSLNPKNPFYNYFQFLPIRTQSNVNAQDLRNYLPQSYKTPSVSRLYEMEQVVIDQSNNQGTNAAMVFATAVHESAYGTSGYATGRNNFFGHSAFDSNPDMASSYVSPGYAFFIHSGKEIKWNYADVRSSSHYRGEVLGNKRIGMNVVYASDPFWGEKIANHYYQIDKKAGFKDLHQYTMGVITSASVNIRKTATTKDAGNSSNIVYQTKYANTPIAIIEEVKGESINGNNIWYGFTAPSPLTKNKDLEPWVPANRDELRAKRFDMASSTVYIHSSNVLKVSNGKNSKLKTQANPTLRETIGMKKEYGNLYTIANAPLRPDWSSSYSPILTIPKGTELKKVFVDLKATDTWINPKVTDNGWVLVTYRVYVDALKGYRTFVGYVPGNTVSATAGGPKIANPTEPPNSTPKNKLGDVNGDGVIDGFDMMEIKRHYLGVKKLTGAAFEAADVNRDGFIDGFDMMEIKRHYLGIKEIK